MANNDRPTDAVDALALVREFLEDQTVTLSVLLSRDDSARLVFVDSEDDPIAEIKTTNKQALAVAVQYIDRWAKT